MPAKRRGRPRTSQRNDRTARIDATVLGWAEIVAKAEGVSVAELLTETLRDPLRRKLARLAKGAIDENGAD